MRESGLVSDNQDPPADGDADARLKLAEEIVEREWAQFQQVQNEGGRASCQDDRDTFNEMRLAQFLTWPRELAASYCEDLEAAERLGRNLLTEKYARMMASTEPERYRRELAPFLPVLSAARESAQEKVIAQQLVWAREFRERYPSLGAGMRVLRTDEDTLTSTSFETYLRGELGTYSERTFALYAELVDSIARQGGNLTESTVLLTARLAGYDSLSAAEAAQARMG